MPVTGIQSSLGCGLVINIELFKMKKLFIILSIILFTSCLDETTKLGLQQEAKKELGIEEIYTQKDMDYAISRAFEKGVFESCKLSEKERQYWFKELKHKYPNW
jgi:hypothetical protein